MKSSISGLAAVLTALIVELHGAPPAEACGVKLTIKSSAPKKAVARTSNPSEVLLLGEPPRRLERDLSAAGHRVEVSPTASQAKRKSYAVVVVDSAHQQEARSNFANSIVVVRSGNVAADMRLVEKQVARKPVRTDEGRDVIAAREPRQPIAAGPTQDPNRKIVSASEPREAQPETPTPPAQPEKAVSSQPKPAPVETRPAPAPARTVAAVPARAPQGEIYFALNRSEQAANALARTVAWMKKSDAQVVIEGHADPSGNPDSNLALAQRRAEWVRDYLVSAGVEASRIEVISYGDTRLKYGRRDPRNRRAAIVIK